MATKKTKQEKDIRDDVLAHLKSDDRKLTWLSDKTSIPYSTLYSIFSKKERSLKEHHLNRINTVLGTQYKL